MPTNVYVPEGEVLEGNDVFLVSRVVRADGVYLSRADVDLAETGSVVNVSVYDLEDRSVTQAAMWTSTTNGDDLAADTLTVLVATAGDLLTDGYWDGLDGTGYNFRLRLKYGGAVPIGPLLEGGHSYRVEVEVVTDTGFGSVRWAHVVAVRSLLST